MKKAIMFAALAAILAGCMDITVKDYGYDVIRDQDGAPLVDKDGKVQTVHKGQKWSYNKNMIEQSSEEFDFSREPGDTIKLHCKNYKDIVSPELTKLVDTSLKGAAELAAKVGAAIATAGGSVAGDAAYSALRSTIAKFISKGGSAKDATVTCKGGSCSISDGTVTETCTDCMYVD